jgi:tetratricopeptide (TPR) repeat protein
MRLKVLCFSAFLAVSAVASAAWEGSVKAAVQAQKKGQWKAAEDQLLKAMFEAEAFPAQDPRLAYTLDYLGLLYLDQGELADAKRVFERALKLFDAITGRESDESLAEAGRLAEACDGLKKWEDSEPLYRRLLEAQLKDGRADSLTLARRHSDLALALDAQAKYGEALDQYQRALELRRAMAAESEEVAETLSNQARIYYMQGRLPEAEGLFRQALAMDEKVSPGRRDLIADDLRRLAPALRKQGKDAEAVVCESRASVLSEDVKKALGRKPGKKKAKGKP